MFLIFVLIGCSKKQDSIEIKHPNLAGLKEIDATSVDAIDAIFPKLSKSHSRELLNLLGVEAVKEKDILFMRPYNGWLLGLEDNLTDDKLSSIFYDSRGLDQEYKVLRQRGSARYTFVAGYVSKVDQDKGIVEIEHANPTDMASLNERLKGLGVSKVKPVQLQIPGASAKYLAGKRKPELDCIEVFGGGKSCSYEKEDFVCAMGTTQTVTNCELKTDFIEKNQLTIKRRLRGLDAVYQAMLSGSDIKESMRPLEQAFGKYDAVGLMTGYIGKVSDEFAYNELPKRCLKTESDGERKISCDKTDEEFLKVIEKIMPKMEKIIRLADDIKNTYLKSN